jgi:hypothetical protein
MFEQNGFVQIKNGFVQIKNGFVQQNDKRLSHHFLLHEEASVFLNSDF